MTAYPCVTCRIPAALEEILPELLEGSGALGSQLRAREDGDLELDVYFPPGSEDAARLAAACLATAGASELRDALVPERDWLEPYREAAVPFPVGERWWLDPRPELPTPAPDGRLRLVLEPRTAFGSGSHESTQLVLLTMEELEFTGRRVLDVGAGSGVLAFAAERLGAGWVVAVDNDAEAVWVARETGAAQDWDASPRLLIGSVDSLRSGAGFDLVLCNMVSSQLLPIAGDLAGCLRPGGAAVLSGLLEAERSEVEARLAGHGLRAVAARTLAEWACVVAVRGG